MTIDIVFSEHNKLLNIGYAGKDYFDSFHKYVSAVENSLRDYLLISNLLIFGPYHNRFKLYPEAIKKYIGQKIVSDIFSYESFNEFENLNRGQYRYLFTQIGKETEFYRYIIEPILRSWEKQDIDAFFNIFGDLNIIAGHGKKSFIEQYRKEIPAFIRLSCRFIATLYERIKNLIISCNCIIYENEKKYVLFGYQFKNKNEINREACIEAVKDLPTKIYKHDITNFVSSEQSAHIDKIRENSNTVFDGILLDINDIDAVNVHFEMKYCEVLSLIAYLFIKNEINVFFPYGDNIFLK